MFILVRYINHMISSNAMLSSTPTSYPPASFIPCHKSNDGFSGLKYFLIAVANHIKRGGSGWGFDN